MLATLVFAAAAVVEGAFGLQFDTPVSAAALRGSLARMDIPFSAQGLSEREVDLPAGMISPWRELAPSEEPGVFASLPRQYFVLLDEEKRPLRIVGLLQPATTCAALAETLIPLLHRRYRRSGSPPSAPVRYGTDNGSLDVRCLPGGELLFDYAADKAIEAWLHRHDKRAREHRKNAALRFADSFLQGSPSRLDGALGVPFRRPFQAGRYTPDEKFERRLPSLPLFLENARTYLTLAPDGNPISVHARLEQPAQGLIERIKTALAAKYPVIVKDTPRHRIHSAGADWAVVRVMQDGALELSFIDRRAHMAMRARSSKEEQARIAAQKAAEKRAFEEASRGL
ncbi:MAG: hypothetical protein NXH85_13725 [Pseudomonadaceae bacterium]|nr:hypothetical protein [Pseudomonadaceae bacterium]